VEFSLLVILENNNDSIEKYHWLLFHQNKLQQ